jgi:hypothetical protein
MSGGFWRLKSKKDSRMTLEKTKTYETKWFLQKDKKMFQHNKDLCLTFWRSQITFWLDLHMRRQK